MENGHTAIEFHGKLRPSLPTGIYLGCTCGGWSTYKAGEDFPLETEQAFALAAVTWVTTAFAGHMKLVRGPIPTLAMRIKARAARR